jgi:hypothetical protein
MDIDKFSLNMVTIGDSRSYTLQYNGISTFIPIGDDNIQRDDMICIDDHDTIINYITACFDMTDHESQHVLTEVFIIINLLYGMVNVKIVINTKKNKFVDLDLVFTTHNDTSMVYSISKYTKVIYYN